MGFSTFNRRDAQRFRKVYPRIRKTPRYFTISSEQMSVESDKIPMVDTTTGMYTFQLEYDEIPTVQLSAELDTTTQGGMVNIYIVTLTTKKVVWETSANFTGNVHLQVFKIGS